MRDMRIPDVTRRQSALKKFSGWFGALSGGSQQQKRFV
jgi:hypothetical protein